MFLKFNKFQRFYSPDDTDTTTPTSEGHDIDDDIKFLSGDDDDDVIDLNKPISDKTKPKDEPKVEKTDDESEDETDENDELEELVDEDEEPNEEQLELVAPVRRKEILKKYPELFKDFPYLEKAYYREQQYTELLPTVQEAKSAVEKSQTLDRFEQDLVKGNIETVFKAVKGEAPNSFAKIVDDLLPTINRVDPAAYNHILGNVMRHTVASMVIEAKKSGSEPLRGAAQILHQFIFGNSEYKPPSRLAKDEPRNEKETELNQKEQEFNRRQFTSAQSDLNTRVNNSLRATIEANIDPKTSMTDYVKRNAVREVSETLEKLMKSDTRFTTILDKLWEQAFNRNFGSDSLDKIRSAYLSKARTLLPSVIKKARIEALRGMGKRISETPDEVKPDKSRPNRGDNNKSVKKSEVPEGMSTLEFLSQD